MTDRAAAVPVILDVDTGVDDALALAMAVRSPHVDLLAVTTVTGNVPIDLTTANTLRVLDWMGAIEIPVHRGASRPLVATYRDATPYHGDDGLGGADLPWSSREIAATRGPAEMIRLAHERPGELTMVAVGPLTNLAIALNVEPRLPSLLGRVVVMGGAFTVAGNATDLAEFNIFVDPDAAAQVFAAGFPDLTVVGLDVTHQTALPLDVWRAADPSTSVFSDLVDRVCARTFTERGMTGFYLHDPLAVGVAIDPDLLETTGGTVSVSLTAEERGMTRIVEQGRIQVATAVDSRRFLTTFCHLMDLPDLDIDQRALSPE